jgi:serine/threonine protein kinase
MSDAADPMIDRSTDTVGGTDTVSEERRLSDSRSSESGPRRARDLATVRKLGRYELKRLLGRGGFGEVWLGLDIRLGRDVAIKLPLFSRADEKRTRRFLSEAKASAALRHPNIIAVYDAGEIDGSLYLATEFADGRVLSEVNDGKALPERQAAQIVAALADALEYAHAANIIHRDLKPHNVILDPQGEPQLLDFGLAKRLDDASQTIDGSVLGTPAYMSPEQARGSIQQVGKLSDQYSLGVILFRLIAGRTPFEGPPAVILQQVNINLLRLDILF